MTTKSEKQDQARIAPRMGAFGSKYCMRKIIKRSLYTFYPIFEGQKHFLRSFFRKILTLCTVSIQEQFQIKSGLCWLVYGICIVDFCKIK